MTRRSWLGCLLGAAALATAACSGPVEFPSPPTLSTRATTESPTPTPSSAELLRDTRTFALAAASGRVQGLVGAGARAVELDLEGSAGGGDQRVRVTGPDGRTAEVLTVGIASWLSGDERFWTERTGSAAKAEALVGAYVPITPAEAADLAPYTLRGLLSEAFARPQVAALEASGTPVADDEVAGVAAWVIGEDDGPRLWVAADGSAELLRIVVPGADPLDLTFGGWGRAETFSAPAAADIRQE
ncbi:hypothetical protein [uncultured Phycicoccus sp.]|uniref:hypothetical protein n=1 Tax=uncultured Phycicoccus sp. TaxID=661422 RepID=UPI002632A7AF|nr:hypothetical protein [uncultured Phycicoccus sp.]